MRALYPGSFDPPHLGHLDLIRRAARLCDDLIIGVAENPDKRPFLSAERRVLLLQAECAALRAVRVVSYRGATTAFAAAQGCAVLIRGVRGAHDLEAEQAMAEVNRSNGLDTLLLPSSSQLIHISSRLVRQVLDAGLPLTGLLSPGVAAAIGARAQP
jgi:pantetheine-phosphate adenylyltransferase